MTGLRMPGGAVKPQDFSLKGQKDSLCLICPSRQEEQEVVNTGRSYRKPAGVTAACYCLEPQPKGLAIQGGFCSW